MIKPAVRCAVYTRKSSEEGLDQSFNSLEAQREACVAYVQSQKHEGWSALKENYDDGGFSGGNMERPALIRLLDDIRTGKVQVVVVYKVDRLTRSLSDFAKIIEIFDSQGVSFVSVTQQFNTTTSMGRLTLNVLLSFAQFERELTGERIRDKLTASKKKGMWMGGVVPLGYDSIDRRLVINQDEAKTVREIFRQYLRLGCVTKLRDYLQEKRIRSKVRTSHTGRSSGGGVYSRGALYHLLGNRIYIGEIVHRGQSYPGQHEPIVPIALWSRASAQLKTNNQARRSPGIRSQSSLLSGILRDTNGVRFTPTHAVKNGKRYRYYTSQTVIQGTGARPNITRLPAEEIERLVVRETGRLLGTLGKNVPEGEVTPDADSAIERARVMASQWSKIERSKQDEFLRRILRGVVVGQDNVWIEIDRALLVSALLGKPFADVDSARRRPGTIKIAVPFRFSRKGAEIRIDTPNSSMSQTAPAPSIVKALAQAHDWYEQLTNGKVSTMEEIASRAGCSSSYIKRILQCALLSPTITEEILSGGQRSGFNLENLRTSIALDWKEQEQMYLDLRIAVNRADCVGDLKRA